MVGWEVVSAIEVTSHGIVLRLRSRLARSGRTEPESSTHRARTNIVGTLHVNAVIYSVVNYRAM